MTLMSILCSCTCGKPFFNTTTSIGNDSEHLVEIRVFRRGTEDTSYAKTISKHGMVGSVYGCENCSFDSIPIDSAQIVFDKSYITTHFERHIDSVSVRHGVLFDHKRNVFNMDNYTAIEKTYSSQGGRCQSKDFQYVYTFTEQDYIDSQK